MPILTCPACGKEFNRPKAHIRNATHACSRECSEKIRKRKPKILIVKNCKHCGIEFTRRKGTAGKLEYCSIRCSTLATTPKGENHPNWKGGISIRTHKVRKTIRDRIQEVGKCEKCGTTEQLQGHHIHSHSEHPELRCDPANIEVLCANCHALEHPNMQNAIKFPKQRSGTFINCQECGKERYVRPHLKDTAKFCSHECQRAALHRLTRSRSHQH